MCEWMREEGWINGWINIMDFQTLVSGNFATYICKGSNNSLVILLKISSQRSDCCYSKNKKRK